METYILRVPFETKKEELSDLLKKHSFSIKGEPIPIEYMQMVIYVIEGLDDHLVAFEEECKNNKYALFSNPKIALF